MSEMNLIRLFYLLFIPYIIFSCSSPEEGETIRLMSFNIAAGHGNLNGIADVIRNNGPDIVALQEVDVHWGERSDFIDQARYLGEALDMHYYMGEIYSFEPDDPADPPRKYGLAFLSKKPIQKTVNHQLTRLSTQSSEPELMELPGFPQIVIEAGGQKIHLFNTHLDYRSDPEIRIIQTEEMMAILKSVDNPVILMGDLNAKPDAPELAPLFEMLSDAWGNRDHAGYTYPAHQPNRRIDYILHSRHFRVTEASVVASEVSDHRAVKADLTFIKN